MQEMEESQANGLERGHAEGRFLTYDIVAARGIPEKLEEKIQKQTKSEILEEWIKF